MIKLLPLAAGAALLAMTSAASAAPLAQLSDGQLDQVSAGGFATAYSDATALGNFFTNTKTWTNTNVNTLGPPYAAAQAAGKAVAASVWFYAAAETNSYSAAGLP
jgi:urea transporter